MAEKEGIRRFFSREEEDAIVDAIRAAELNTSGEIRVHIEEHCKGDAFKRATKVFHQLKMDATDLHNGILFYIAQTDHKFSIIGDKGINEKVPADFWNEIRDDMQTHFRQGAYADGLIKGIGATGKALKEFFPYQQGKDINELPDDISHG